MKTKNFKTKAPNSDKTIVTKGGTVVYCAVIIVLCLLVFGSGINFKFTNWDDPVHVLENPDIKSLSGKNLKAMFQPNDRYMYHPLTILSYAINYSSSQLSPQTYHLTNILLHTITALLMFYILLLLFSNKQAALIGALLFALHPLMSEPVNWISGRKDVLFGCFYLAGLLYYLRYTKSKSSIQYLASVLFFTASMLSKPMAVSFPIVIFILDKYLKRKTDTKLLLEKLPFAIVAFAIFIIPVWNQHMGPANPDSFTYSFTENYTWLNRGILSLNAIAFYPFKFLFPTGLTAYHGFPPLSENMLPWHLYVIPVLLAVVCFVILRFSKTKSDEITGLLIYIVSIAPVIHLVKFGTNIYLAERYAYIPVLGLIFIISSYIVKYIQQPATRTKLLAISTIVIAALGIATLIQNQTWKNSIALWNKNIDVYPSGFYGYFNRANEYKNQGKQQEALTDYNSSIKFNPKFMEAYYNRGNVLSDLNDNQPAIRDFTSAIEINPKYYVAYFNRGNSKAALNDFDGAIKDYTDAIRLNNKYEEAYANRGNARGMVKDYLGSIEDYNKSIELNPDNASAISNRGLSRLNLNDKAGACSDLNTAAAMGNQQALELVQKICK